MNKLKLCREIVCCNDCDYSLILKAQTSDFGSAVCLCKYKERDPFGEHKLVSLYYKNVCESVDIPEWCPRLKENEEKSRYACDKLEATEKEMDEVCMKNRTIDMEVLKWAFHELRRYTHTGTAAETMIKFKEIIDRM